MNTIISPFQGLIVLVVHFSIIMSALRACFFISFLATFGITVEFPRFARNDNNDLFLELENARNDKEKFGFIIPKD